MCKALHVARLKCDVWEQAASGENAASKKEFGEAQKVAWIESFKEQEIDSVKVVKADYCQREQQEQAATLSVRKHGKRNVFPIILLRIRLWMGIKSKNEKSDFSKALVDCFTYPIDQKAAVYGVL